MGKQRSPNYPAIGLGAAVDAVAVIYEKEKKTTVSGEVIAGALGYSSMSGNARSKISALKKYGLLEGDERKGLRVTDLAVSILYPRSAPDQKTSLQQAALIPDLFRMLYSEFREGSDAAILHHLINKLDFAPQGAKQLLQSYRETINFALLHGSVYNDSGTSDKQEAHSMQTAPAADPVGDFTRSDAFRGFSRGSVPSAAESQNVWTWTLSVPRQVNAQLHISGEVSKADIVRLRKQIDLLEEAFDENEQAAK